MLSLKSFIFIVILIVVFVLMQDAAGYFIPHRHRCRSNSIFLRGRCKKIVFSHSAPNIPRARNFAKTYNIVNPCPKGEVPLRGMCRKVYNLYTEPNFTRTIRSLPRREKKLAVYL